MFKDILEKLLRREDLNRAEAAGMMEILMEGRLTEAQTGALLTALRMKGESVDEITGCAQAVRQKALKIFPRVTFCIDTCGTGGDASGTFNISTAAALVAAAGGVAVAKHGNRSISSRSGSADVLEALGVRIDLAPERVERCIEVIGIGFLFAPAFHGAMRHAAAARRELGIRTIFNLIGPLANPAGARGQVVGVYDPGLTEPIAGVLRNLGVQHALVICGMDGLDELTVTAGTRITELKDGGIRTYDLVPEDVGVKRADMKALKGGDPRENAEVIRRILSGGRGPKRDITVLNAGAALYVGGAAASIKEGVLLAERILDSGEAEKTLESLVQMTQSDRREAAG